MSSAIELHAARTKLRWSRSLAWKYPVFAWEMAGVPVGKALKIVLMNVLGFPEVARGRELGHELSWPKSRFFDIGDGALCLGKLFITIEEYCGPVLAAAISALPIDRSWIVNLEKELYQLAKACLYRIKNDLECFGMTVRRQII